MFKFGVSLTALLWAQIAWGQARPRYTGPTPPPVRQVVPIPSPAPSPTEQYGKWEVGLLAGMLYAKTSNLAGQVFGVLCDESCTTFMNVKTACGDGISSPALINSPAGSFSVMFKCRHIGRNQIMSANIDSLLIDAMEIGGDLHVAFPLESGRFQIIDFSLIGAMKATLRAYGLSEAARKGRAGEQGLRDQTT